MITYPNKQRGVVLFIAMIALVVLMIAAVALIRSTDTAQMIAGNLAIKRDMTHESQEAIEVALANFDVGGTLGTELSRWGDVTAANYHAQFQPSNAYGIPTALLQDSTTGAATAYTNNGMTYLYMIDRMCPAVGAPNLATSHCIVDAPEGPAIDAFNPLQGGEKGTPSANKPVVYRVSVRLTDPKRTQSFFQTTVAGTGS
jgi:type IV pilus assembly protein PilX